MSGKKCFPKKRTCQINMTGCSKESVVSTEVLFHFQCVDCAFWWTIGDAHVSGTDVFACPRCGVIHSFDLHKTAKEALKKLNKGE